MAVSGGPLTVKKTLEKEGDFDWGAEGGGVQSVGVARNLEHMRLSWEAGMYGILERQNRLGRVMGFYGQR